MTTGTTHAGTTNERSDLRKLRDCNVAAWEGATQPRASGSLDSSLKKNTAFIKRARIALNAENRNAFLTDIDTLSLEKYISEVVSAIAEGLTKVKLSVDVTAAVEVVSALHQRFATQFTPFLALAVLKSLAVPPSSYLDSLSPEQREKEETGRALRQRSLLRVATELWLAGILRTVQDALNAAGSDLRKRKNEEAIPVFCLRDLLNNDRDFVNLGIASTFAKHYAWLLPHTREYYGCIQPSESETIRLVLQKYFSGLSLYLSRQTKVIAKETDKLEENSLNYGSVSTAKEIVIQEMRKNYERQLAAAQTLANALQVEMPVLQDREDDPTEAADSMIKGFGHGKVSDGNEHESNVWEDDEQRRFYEVLTDLKDQVPSDLLNDGKQRQQAPEDGSSSPALVSAEDVELEYDDDELDEVPTVLEEEIDIPTASTGARLGTLLLRIPELNNKDLIDSAAVEFSFLNSKASRNRLIRTLLDVPNHRTDILPYYARLIATLSKYMPSISETIADSLHRDCRRFVRGRGLSKDLPLRYNNIRFLSELIKFNLLPKHITFHCFKILTESFSKNDIDVLATLLESCGRFLLRSPGTSAKMQSILETIARKAKNVSGVERSVIDNAFYYVNPPPRVELVRRTRSPLELYIRDLVLRDLNAKTADKVLRQLKKLDWVNRQEYACVRSLFAKPWKVRFSTIQYLAVVLCGLAKSHSFFAIEIVDTILENIRTGLEENRFRDNQKRLATVKYLAELYNYKLIDANLIFDVLYLILSFGHPSGKPGPDGCSVDKPQEFFRIRMVLAILDTCGKVFTSGHNRKKLDVFIVFFQYYIQLKVNRSLDIDFDVADTLHKLRPKLHIFDNLEGAAKALDELLAQPSQNNETLQDHESDNDDATDVSERIARDRDSSMSPEHSFTGSMDEDDYVLLGERRMQDELEQQADEDLSRELSKMMSESTDVRMQERTRPLEIMLPRKIQTPKNGAASDTAGVSFTFLSRKSKPRTIQLPADSSLVISNTAQRVADQQEKEAIKNLVIKYETAYNKDELEDAGSKPGAGIRYTSPMLAGQKGGQRSGSYFRTGPQRQRRTEVREE